VNKITNLFPNFFLITFVSLFLIIKRMDLELYDRGLTAERMNSNPFMPAKPARILAIGPTGSGKSTVAMNMIKRGWIEFDNLYCWCKSIDEELYEMVFEWKEETTKMKEYIKSLRNVSCLSKKERNMANLEFGEIIISNDLDDLVSYEDLKKGEKNLIIIDDFLADKKLHSKEINDLFFRCRKKGASIILMAQTFFSLPDDIRTQASHYILCRGSDGGKRNALMTMQQAICSELSSEDFKRMYTTNTQRVTNSFIDINGNKKDIVGFFYVDKQATNKQLKYRCNFDRDVETGERIIL